MQACFFRFLRDFLFLPAGVLVSGTLYVVWPTSSSFALVFEMFMGRNLLFIKARTSAIQVSRSPIAKTLARFKAFARVEESPGTTKNLHWLNFISKITSSKKAKMENWYPCAYNENMCVTADVVKSFASMQTAASWQLLSLASEFFLFNTRSIERSPIRAREPKVLNKPIIAQSNIKIWTFFFCLALAARFFWNLAPIGSLSLRFPSDKSPFTAQSFSQDT